MPPTSQTWHLNKILTQAVAEAVSDRVAMYPPGSVITVPLEQDHIHVDVVGLAPFDVWIVLRASTRGVQPGHIVHVRFLRYADEIGHVRLYSSGAGLPDRSIIHAIARLVEDHVMENQHKDVNHD